MFSVKTVPPAAMKILLLFDHYFPYIGGAEIVNQNIAEHFNKKYEVIVVSKKFKGLNGSRHNVNGVVIHRTANVPRLLHSIMCYISAQHYAREADLIFSATYASGLAGYWLSKKFKKKSVLLVHEILGENWKLFKKAYFLYNWFERYIVTRRFDGYITVSHYTKQKLEEYGVSDNKITVIYNGVDEGLFRPRPINKNLRKKLVVETAFVYLYFGRPGGSKGLVYLLRAVPAISGVIPDSKLVLILGSEPRNEYRKAMRLIDNLNIRDRIILLPSVPRDQLPDYVNIADVVVIPSLSEGFGFSAVESCILGKKIVVTDTGALPETIFGRVIKIPKADSDALAGGVCRAYRDEYEQVPEKKFRWEESLDKYDNVIQTIANNILSQF
jgi:glycosyltransferase involved in cell wall biosynthesis